jgi:hypothetical protein
MVSSWLSAELAARRLRILKVTFGFGVGREDQASLD